MEIQKEKICSKKFTILVKHSAKKTTKYLIGVQVSKLLQRQTFNLYRSLKLKGIELIRASPQEMGFLLQTRSIRQNIHSVTLVPYDQGKSFILENWRGVSPSSAVKTFSMNSLVHSFQTTSAPPTPSPVLSSQKLKITPDIKPQPLHYLPRHHHLSQTPGPHHSTPYSCYSGCPSMQPASPPPFPPSPSSPSSPPPASPPASAPPSPPLMYTSLPVPSACTTPSLPAAQPQEKISSLENLAIHSLLFLAKGTTTPVVKKEPVAF